MSIMLFFTLTIEIKKNIKEYKQYIYIERNKIDMLKF